jgi:hypothetical protein
MSFSVLHDGSVHRALAQPLRYCGGPKGKHWETEGERSYLLFPEHHLYFKHDWHLNCGYSEMSFWLICSQKWTKWAAYFRKNTWSCLLPMMKSELPRKKKTTQNFRKLYLVLRPCHLPDT